VSSTAQAQSTTPQKTGRHPRIGFIMEQTLGHRAHYRTLTRLVAEDAAIEPVWLPIAFEPQGLVARVPGLRSNWSARASLLAWRAVRRTLATQPLDALFYHTQVTALLAPIERAAPAVISLDATPRNYDTVGQYYGHASGGWAEGAKRSINRHAFDSAVALVTWCAWARESLIHDYGVAAEKITTIAPGVDLTRWRNPSMSRAEMSRALHRPRLLFVGGDFARKGGELLLESFTHAFAERCDLWIVTQDPVPERPGVRVWRNISPGSEELPRLYAEADAFIFPTLADCAPLVIPEAMAAALPVVSTSVGAIPEMVRDGETGLVIPPGDGEALRGAIERLIEDPSLRLCLGEAGRREVEAHYDARKNAGRLLDLLKRVAGTASTQGEIIPQVAPQRSAARR
jgi:glycosyltransferase involved in cell wall biosynthesis